MNSGHIEFTRNSNLPMGNGRFPTNSQSINFRSGGGADGARILSGQTGHFLNFLEIATDFTTRPIFVRQYGPYYNELIRTLTLLDANGNTNIPGNIINTDLTNRLNAKSDTVHTHTIANITNLKQN